MPVGSTSHDWLAVSFAPGLTPRIRRALVAADRPADRWADRIAEAASRRLASIDLQRAFDLGAADSRTRAALDWLAADDHHLLSVDDADYPPLLREIDDAPLLLYMHGRRELLGRPALAIVGSRNPSASGAQAAEAFARSFSCAGLTVVSGLALGIDAAAHRGALGRTGSTIAVVGTGMDIVYPARNRALAHQVAATGLLISEFPLGEPARPDHFPRRNRIISGLALGCLVVEANLRSGSLITARLSAEQGREVFAVPGSIHSPLAKGCHALIKQGAKLTESAADVIEELGWRTRVTPSGEPTDPRLEACSAMLDLDSDSRAVLSVLDHEPISADDLGDRLGWNAQRVSAAVLDLELAGRLAPAGHGTFQRLADPGSNFAGEKRRDSPCSGAEQRPEPVIRRRLDGPAN